MLVPMGMVVVVTAAGVYLTSRTNRQGPTPQGMEEPRKDRLPRETVADEQSEPEPDADPPEEDADPPEEDAAEADGFDQRAATGILAALIVGLGVAFMGCIAFLASR
jgi:hypothetical protein